MRKIAAGRVWIISFGQTNSSSIVCVCVFIFILLFWPNNKEVGANSDKQQTKRSILGVVCFYTNGSWHFGLGKWKEASSERATCTHSPSLHRHCDDKRRSKYALRTSNEPLFASILFVVWLTCIALEIFVLCIEDVVNDLSPSLSSRNSGQKSSQLNAVSVAYGGIGGEPIGACRKTTVEQRPVSCRECTHFHWCSRQM